MMIYMAILTSSFDVFLTWQIGGTIRFCQVIMIIPYVYLTLDCIRKKRIILPESIYYLLIWNVFMLVFVLNTDVLIRSVGYWIWLTLNIANIILLVNIFTTKKDVFSLLRWYCFSFVFVAAFGLLQFVSAPILKLSTPLVAQWWIPGVLARINGFSYEPSYYATYILIGWCFIYFLLKKRNQELFGVNAIRLMFAITTLAMILSSSRMGILMMLIVVVSSNIYCNAKKIIVNLLKMKIETRIVKNVTLFLALFISLSYMLLSNDYFDEYSFLLGGTGIGGTPAHSVDTRTLYMEKTLNVFYESPVIGASLGGVAEKIAIDENQRGELKDSEGTAVALEVLAASGIIGVIPFILYFYRIIKKSVLKFYVTNDGIGLGILWALVAEIVILQLNQNILRPYFWIHIAVLSVYFRIKSIKEE